MILPWRWREVYCAYTMKDKELVFSTLEKAGIRYDYSVTGSTDPGKVREGFSGLSFHHAAELRVFCRWPADRGGPLPRTEGRPGGGGDGITSGRMTPCGRHLLG